MTKIASSLGLFIYNLLFLIFGILFMSLFFSNSFALSISIIQKGIIFSCSLAWIIVSCLNFTLIFYGFYTFDPKKEELQTDLKFINLFLMLAILGFLVIAIMPEEGIVPGMFLLIFFVVLPPLVYFILKWEGKRDKQSILKYLAKNKEGLSFNQIKKEFIMNTNELDKYLEILEKNGKIERRHISGKELYFSLIPLKDLIF